MTEREEIDMLRRLVADLTERVRALEARPAVPAIVPIGPAPSLPYLSPVMPYAVPWTPMPPVTCGDPTPIQPITTCMARVDGNKTSLWHEKA